MIVILSFEHLSIDTLMKSTIRKEKNDVIDRSIDSSNRTFVPYFDENIGVALNVIVDVKRDHIINVVVIRRRQTQQIVQFYR